MTFLRSPVLATVVACMAVPMAACAAPAIADRATPRLTVEVEDLTPAFLRFWEAARDVSDPDQRWSLWRQHYGFAAVPPGPQGEAMARRLLDAAWSRYPAALPMIQAGAGLQPEAEATLARVAAVLRPDRPVDVKVAGFVGAFDNNAFTYTIKGRPVVNVPVEAGPARRQAALAHELAHAVHLTKAGLPGGWERSLATTVLMEGLAMHVARELTPGLPEEAYVGGRPGWWAEAKERQAAILGGVSSQLAATDGQTTFRFTIGRGPAGLEQEAYAAGWFVVERLLARGMTLAEIGAVHEPEIPALVRSVSTAGS